MDELGGGRDYCLGDDLEPGLEGQDDEQPATTGVGWGDDMSQRVREV